IFVRLVPGRRQPQDRERIAGAERADDEVMHVRGVLDRLQMPGRVAREAEFANRLGSVGQKPRLEGGIDPGARDYGGAALRPNLVAIHFDPGVDRGGFDELLLHEQAFQRLRPQGRLGGQERMQLVVNMGDRLRVEARHSLSSLPTGGRAYHLALTSKGGAYRLGCARRANALAWRLKA